MWCCGRSRLESPAEEEVGNILSVIGGLVGNVSNKKNKDVEIIRFLKRSYRESEMKVSLEHALRLRIWLGCPLQIMVYLINVEIVQDRQ